MSAALYVELLDLACGGLLLTAVLVLWLRELSAIITIFAAQGLALTAVVTVLAVQQQDLELGGVAAGILLLRSGLLPWLLRRALAEAGQMQREIRPLINVVSSLLAAAGLTLLAYAVSQPLISLAPTPAGHDIPVGMAVVLIGFFVLISRRLALSQVVGFLLMDNGITTVAFLTTSGVGLVIELGISMDLLLVVIVLQVLNTHMRTAFGATDLDELRELHD